MTPIEASKQREFLVLRMLVMAAQEDVIGAVPHAILAERARQYGRAYGVSTDEIASVMSKTIEMVICPVEAEKYKEPTKEISSEARLGVARLNPNTENCHDSDSLASTPNTDTRS